MPRASGQGKERGGGAGHRPPGGRTRVPVPPHGRLRSRLSGDEAARRQVCRGAAEGGIWHRGGLRGPLWKQVGSSDAREAGRGPARLSGPPTNMKKATLLALVLAGGAAHAAVPDG